jgi:small-conductance mechanosensitive channel
MLPSVLLRVDRLPILAATLAVVYFLADRRGEAAGPPFADDDSQANQSELHRLKNDELLKQAGAIYGKAAEEYRATVRALAAAEIMLQEASERTAMPRDTQTSPSPARSPAGNGLTAEAKAQAAVDEAKVKQAVAREKIKLVQTRQELLHGVSTRVDAGQTAADEFLQALDELKPYTIEIGLRVKDESLEAAKVPRELDPDALAKKRQDVAADQVKWKKKVADAPKARAAVAEQLDMAKTEALAADAELARAAKALAQENKRLEMESTHARKSRDGMLDELARLVEEGNGLRGTYELALARFDRQSDEVARRRAELNALKQPEVDVPQIARAEDVEAAVKSIQESIDYYSAQIRAIEGLRDALTSLAKDGKDFEVDAEVSADHLFKMNVLAELLRKAGVAEDKYPDGGQPKKVAAVVDRVSTRVVEVQAAIEQGKSELTALGKQLAEANQAAGTEAKQLAYLKDSQAVTTAALKWEEQFRGMSAARIAESFAETKQDLATKLQILESDKDAYQTAAAAVNDARAKLDELKDPLLRQAEEREQPERLRIASELRKDAGLDETAEDAAPAAQDDSEGDKKTARETEPEPDKRTDQEKITDTLAEFEHRLTARDQLLDAREKKTKDLLAKLDNLETKAAAYNGSLAEALQLAIQLYTAAVDLKKRRGRGELSGEKMPDGVTEAVRDKRRTKFESDMDDLRAALEQVTQEREKLRRPDSEADAFKAVTIELRDLVVQRRDLLADLKKLAAEYDREEKDRSPSDVKRLDQIAADRRADDGTAADWLLGIDPSEKAKSLEDLLGTYYRELIEIEEKDDNLKKQEDKINQLIELARSEKEAVIRAQPLLDDVVDRLQAAQDEDWVVARTRLHPEQADELRQDYWEKTGQWPPTPAPFEDTERAVQVDKIAGVLFERRVQRRAAERWGEVLADRLASDGIKGEDVYYEEALARLETTSEEIARRVAVLTGVKPPDSGEAVAANAAKRRVVGGEIGNTRKELTAARTDGVKTIGIKIVAILVAAFLLPRILFWALRRATGGDTGLVLSALTTFLKTGVWVIAFAIVLSVLGFDVTAIVAGLGIGGLAIGLAAQPMIADMIAALVIFAEGKFKIGEVIKLGNSEPAKVVGLAWRSTQLRNTLGLVAHIPNRQVTEQTVQNLTKGGKIFDVLEVTVTTQREVPNVLAVIKKALEECRYLTADHGVTVREFTQKGETKIVKYRFWWFVEQYEGRDKTRDEVFTRISRSLDDEDLKETEVSLA